MLWRTVELDYKKVFVEFAEIIASQYDIPHVDEIQSEMLEREYEMRDEVYPDEEEHSSPD